MKPLFPPPGEPTPSKELAWTVRLGAFAVTAGAMTMAHIRESSCPGCPVEHQGLVANSLFFTIPCYRSTARRDLCDRCSSLENAGDLGICADRL